MHFLQSSVDQSLTAAPRTIQYHPFLADTAVYSRRDKHWEAHPCCCSKARLTLKLTIDTYLSRSTTSTYLSPPLDIMSTWSFNPEIHEETAAYIRYFQDQHLSSNAYGTGLSTGAAPAAHPGPTTAAAQEGVYPRARSDIGEDSASRATEASSQPEPTPIGSSNPKKRSVEDEADISPDSKKARLDDSQGNEGELTSLAEIAAAAATFTTTPVDETALVNAAASALAASTSPASSPRREKRALPDEDAVDREQ